MNEGNEENCVKNEKIEKILTPDILQFIKDVCVANQSFQNEENSAKFDYNSLAANAFIASHLNLEPSKNNGGDSDQEKSKFNGKSIAKVYFSLPHFFFLSTRIQIDCTEPEKQFQSTNIHPSLLSKLDEMVNEGILDSILPFICSLNSSVQNYNITHTCDSSMKVVQDAQIIQKDDSPTQTSKAPKNSDDSIVEKRTSDHVENTLVQVKDKSVRRKSLHNSKNVSE